MNYGYFNDDLEVAEVFPFSYFLDLVFGSVEEEAQIEITNYFYDLFLYALISNLKMIIPHIIYSYTFGTYPR